MFGYFLLVGVLAICFTRSIGKEDQIDNLSLTEQVKKMDEILSAFQSQYQEQKRKDATTLANILSDLSQTKGELEKLKTSHNKTVSLYQQALSELTDLKTSLNGTVLELTALQQVDTVCHNKDIGKECHNKDIGFEAYLGIVTSVSASVPIAFDTITHNEGNGYDKTTGYFTAPVSGTYLFWMDILFRTRSTSFTFYIESGKGVFGRAMKRSDKYSGSASATTQCYLKEGERVWIHATKDVTLQADFSSAGAVLIKQY